MNLAKGIHGKFNTLLWLLKVVIVLFWLMGESRVHRLPTGYHVLLQWLVSMARDDTHAVRVAFTTRPDKYTLEFNTSTMLRLLWFQHPHGVLLPCT